MSRTKLYEFERWDFVDAVRISNNAYELLKIISDKLFGLRNKIINLNVILLDNGSQSGKARFQIDGLSYFFNSTENKYYISLDKNDIYEIDLANFQDGNYYIVLSYFEKETSKERRIFLEPETHFEYDDVINTLVLDTFKIDLIPQNSTIPSGSLIIGTCEITNNIIQNIQFDNSNFLTYNFDNISINQNAEPILTNINQILKTFAFLIAQIKGTRWYEIPPKNITEITNDIQYIQNLLSQLQNLANQNFLLSYENYLGTSNNTSLKSLKIRENYTLQNNQTWDYTFITGFSNSKYATINLNNFTLTLNSSKIENIKFENGIIIINGDVEFENCHFDNTIQIQGQIPSKISIKNSYIDFTNTTKIQNVQEITIINSYCIFPATKQTIISNANYIIFTNNIKEGYHISNLTDMLDIFGNPIDIVYSNNIEK